MFLFCLFVCLFVLLSRSLQSHLEAVLSKFKILSCTNNKKNGKTGDSKADRSSSKLHKSHKNGPNSPKLPSKDLSIICLSLLCFWSLGFHQKLLHFFHQSFLSLDAFDRALGRDVINDRSKLTSQRQFTSVRERAQCSFDRDKARQNFTRAVFFVSFLV